MDLNAPLGTTPPPQDAAAKSRLPAGGASPPPRRRWFLSACGLVVAGVGAAVGVMLWRADPHGGEPYVVATIPPQATKPPVPPPGPKPAAQLDPIATGSIAPSAVPAPSPRGEPTAPMPPGVAHAPGGPLIIDVAKVLAEREHAAVPAGADPEPVVAPPAVAARPRIAIFVSGMGLSASATRTATEMMPSAVSLAFVPYGETVSAAVSAAKARGHEILLQVPMQSRPGGPGPGPHAIQAGEPAPQVDADLAWLMGRIDGYDGVANFLGAPVTSDRNAMAEVLKAVAARGLFYVDDGTSKRSLGQALALAQGMPAVRADVVLDATADPAAVQGNLEALLALAKRNGSAIGMASGLPDHLAAIAAFAAGLAARGVDLVPVSTLAGRDATMTVAK